MPSLHYGSGLSGRAFTSTLVVTDVPFTVAGWVRAQNVTTQQTLFYLGAKSATAAADSHRVILSATGQVQLNSRNAAGTGALATAAAVTVNTWTHVGGICTGPALRKAFKDGTVSQNTTSITVGTATGMALGTTMVGAAFGTYLSDGQLENWALWNVALLDVEIAALAKGVQPIHIRPQSLVHWWRNMGTLAVSTTVRDIMDAAHLTTANTTSSAEGPSMPGRRPWHLPQWRAAAAAPPSPPRIVVLF